MPLSDLLAKFNFQDYKDLPLQNLASTGKFSNYLFIFSLSVTFIILILLILLVEGGKAFISLGVALMASGGIIYLLANLGTKLNAMLVNDLVARTSITSVISGVMFPPIITEVMASWRALAVIILLIGIAMFFIKKPSYNSPK